jgi:hypothetical protein
MAMIEKALKICDDVIFFKSQVFASQVSQLIEDGIGAEDEKDRNGKLKDNQGVSENRPLKLDFIVPLSELTA